MNTFSAKKSPQNKVGLMEPKHETSNPVLSIIPPTEGSQTHGLCVSCGHVAAAEPCQVFWDLSGRAQ